MKIQINTENKSISVLDDVNLNELMENLQKLFPNGEWKEYKLEKLIETSYIPSTPIIINDRWWRRTNPYPWIEWNDFSEEINEFSGKVDNFTINPNDPNNMNKDYDNYSYYSSIEQGHEGNSNIFLLDIK